MRTIYKVIVSVFLVFNLYAVPGIAENAVINGKVVGIHDGDTLTLHTQKNKALKVRLGGIDAPELEQSYGQDSKKELSRLAFGKQVRIVQTDIDRYKRTVGNVYIENTDINLEMVKVGAAWVYREYSRDPTYLKSESEARKLRNGLWKLQTDQITPPWEWRRINSTRSNRANAPIVSRNSNHLCSTKKYCSQMKSCEEAKYFYEICKLSLDGDNDGTPCEKICMTSMKYHR